MPEKNKINVMIDGRNFTVVGEDDEDYVRNLAYYVDKKIRDLARNNIRLSQAMAATLAALNIADELSKTRTKLKELEEKAKEPLEKFGGVNKELEECRVKVKELEKLTLEYKDEVIKTKLSMEEQYKEISKAKEELELKELEIKELKNMNKGLQDKNFQNQLELVETKKEIDELLKFLDQDKE